MVTIIDFVPRSNAEGKVFYSLFLQGGIEMVKSRVSDNYYATIKKCSITSTFDEATCKASIGEKLPGSIQKKPCEPYEFTVKETGEIIALDFRWVYLPEGATLEEVVWEGETAVHSNKSSSAIFI
jgi:hypothetical protein